MSGRKTTPFPIACWSTTNSQKQVLLCYANLDPIISLVLHLPPVSRELVSRSCLYNPKPKGPTPRTNYNKWTQSTHALSIHELEKVHGSPRILHHIWTPQIVKQKECWKKCVLIAICRSRHTLNCSNQLAMHLFTMQVNHHKVATWQLAPTSSLSFSYLCLGSQRICNT